MTPSVANVLLSTSAIADQAVHRDQAGVVDEQQAPGSSARQRDIAVRGSHGMRVAMRDAAQRVQIARSALRLYQRFNMSA